MESNNSQGKEPDDSPIETLRLHFARQALTSVTVERNEQDSYSISVVPTGGDLSPRLTEADAIALLPRGSRWLPAVGWHSYIGIPFRFDGQMWLAIGVELIKRHHSRGAYVSFSAFIFPFRQPPVQQLKRFADELFAPRPQGERNKAVGAESTFLQKPLKLVADGLKEMGFLCNSHKIIEANSKTPTEHAQVEAHIIRKAAASYDKNGLLLFRTLILSENQLERPASLFTGQREKKTLARLQIRYYKYLAATVPAIKSTFSSQARYS